LSSLIGFLVAVALLAQAEARTGPGSGRVRILFVGEVASGNLHVE